MICEFLIIYFYNLIFINVFRNKYEFGCFYCKFYVKYFVGIFWILGKCLDCFWIVFIFLLIYYIVLVNGIIIWLLMILFVIMIGNLFLDVRNMFIILLNSLCLVEK